MKTIPLSSLAVCCLCALGAAGLHAQSSSLFVGEMPPPPPQRVPVNGQPVDRLAPAIADVSFVAVRIPEPKRFAVQDLVTIIVRESTENDSDAKLDTKKDTSYSGEVSSFPDIRVLQQFTDLFLKSGLQDKPKLGMSYKNDFKADASVGRKDSFTTRVTARVIDVRPNGTLVLEARKYIKTDEETLDLVLTGTCRKEDVTADNTVLSTQLYDLVLHKQHTGELREAAKKGWISKVLNGLFAF